MLAEPLRSTIGPTSDSPASDNPASGAAAWQVDRLDLDGYLRRVGHHGSLTPDESTLTALHRAHVATIPFENLDVMLGRGVEVDLPSVQRKLVAGRRGGYCYEHNVLFGAVLQRLGYRVDRLLARTGDPLEHATPRSHLVLRVASGDAVWLADVGFGSGLLAPLPFAEGPPRRQGAWEYELTTGRDGAWRLRERAAGAWTTVLTFTEEPQYPVDVAVANANTATHPRSPFVQRCIVVRKDAACVRRLLGREFSLERPGRPTVQRRVDDAEFADVLRTEFDIDLDAAAVRVLLTTPPRGDDE